MGTAVIKIAVRNRCCDFVILLSKICFRNASDAISVTGRIQQGP
jgi:hypothetical protein